MLGACLIFAVELGYSRSKSGQENKNSLEAIFQDQHMRQLEREKSRDRMGNLIAIKPITPS